MTSGLDQDRVRCGRCGDDLTLNELEGHLASEGRTLADLSRQAKLALLAGGTPTLGGGEAGIVERASVRAVIASVLADKHALAQALHDSLGQLNNESPFCGVAHPVEECAFAADFIERAAEVIGAWPASEAGIDVEPSTLERHRLAGRIMASLDAHGKPYMLTAHPADLAYAVADDLLPYLRAVAADQPETPKP